MNIKDQEYFIKLAEYRNFSKAAKDLYISQTALSKVIAGLEDEVGEKLFIRNTNSVSLSEAGRVYLDYAKKIVSLYSQSQSIIHRSLLEGGTLRIGVTDLSDSLINALGILHQKFPNAKVRLYSDQLSAGAFSFSKLDMIMLPEDAAKDLNYIPIAAKKRILDLPDLEQEDLIFSIGENGRLDAAYDYCLKAGFKPKVSFLFNDSKYQMDIILNSSAVAVSFNLFRRFRETMDSIVSIPININHPINDRLVLAYREDNRNPLIPEMIQCIQAFREIRFSNE